MPPPFKVELISHDPRWARDADRESQTFTAAAGHCVQIVHHIGSTAIPGIHAKPVLDLMPVVTSLRELDDRQREIEALGYEWWGSSVFPAGVTVPNPTW